MPIFEPLAVLAAVFALMTCGAWWQVAKVAHSYGADANRVNRKLYLASVGTVLVLGLGAASILAPAIASVFV
jgi:hypothetical protein